MIRAFRAQSASRVVDAPIGLRSAAGVASKAVAAAALVAAASLTASLAAAAAADYPVTAGQRDTAQRVAQQGVPVEELAPDAPDTYTVKPRDTLWDISKVYLRSPWRWPALWGMNLDQVRNPHLIYPGQLLVLERRDGRARLRFGQALGAGGTERLEPRVRSSAVGAEAIASIPFSLIEPFLNEAVIFPANELADAPRIVATQEGRIVLGRGDTAYVRGDVSGGGAYRIFREPKALVDPTTREVLGFEAVYVGAAEAVSQGETRIDAGGRSQIVPAAFRVTELRQEAGVGDRLAVVAAREYANYAPHAPQNPIDGRIVSLYGDSLTAGQNQIVALNRGAADGIERGTVLALVRDGGSAVDTTDPARPKMKLPDERHGLLFVFRVFDRMSYALILSVKEPVAPGDRFTQP